MTDEAQTLKMTVREQPTVTRGLDLTVPLRGRLLDKAKTLTMGERNRDYGMPHENMDHIASIFNAITGRDLTGEDVAMVHLATKLARRKTSPQIGDHYVDGMAYLGIAAECVEATKAKVIV